MALASVVVSLCAALVKVIEPPTVPLLPVGRLIVRVFVPLMLSCEPAATESAFAPPLTVKVVPVAAGCSVTAVLPETCNLPIVCVGTPVTVVVAPLLKTRMSLVAGVVRVGVQFVEVVHGAAPV